MMTNSSLFRRKTSLDGFLEGKVFSLFSSTIIRLVLEMSTFDDGIF